jgi:glycine cleavage system H lipoate-binding protein
MVVLLIILTFIAAILIEMYIERTKEPAEVVSTASPKVFTKKNLFIPDGYKISSQHIWINQSGKDYKIGLDNFIIDALGQIYVKQIRQAGEKIDKGDIIATVNISGRTLHFRSPISGVINYVNPKLMNSAVKDPYYEDYLYSVAQVNEKPEMLLFGNEAVNWIKSEFRRLKEFLADTPYKPVGVTMYDGGNVVEGIVSSLDDDSLLQFEETFLKDGK